MSNSNWGGSRNGAGRPRRKWDSQNQEEWVVIRQPISPKLGKPLETMEVWRLLSIGSDGMLEFQNTNTGEIISIIHPDHYV